MSLYYHAEATIVNVDKVGGSLKSRVYNKKDGKHAPAQVFALISEATKWSAVLKEVIEKSGLLAAEKKLSSTLAVLLVHDLLLSKRGIAAPSSHALRLAVSRHRARLQAEFVKIRVRKGFASVDALRKDIEQQYHYSGNEDAAHSPHPRWVRINVITTTVQAQLSSTFRDYERLSSLEEVLSARKDEKVYHVDEHVPNLIALPPNHDISRSSAYQSGQIIFQDKASCIPAVLLDPQSLAHGGIIDACAAPGNKTTHLAALLAGSMKTSENRSIFAVERNPARSKIMRKMVSQAGALDYVTIMESTDFLALTPEDRRLQSVTSILLDPSCSGSGIVGRDDESVLELPAIPTPTKQSNDLRRSKKRKHNDSAPASTETLPDDQTTELLDESKSEESRLESLSKFQLKLLLHAMTFPGAQRIVYSTCSIHAKENEDVVIQALWSPVAVQYGWTVLSRDRQVVGMRAWEVRGDMTACEALLSTARFSSHGCKPVDIAEACIRCEKGTKKGTMGFFACGFVRSINSSSSVNSSESSDIEQEWEGFAD